MKAPALLLLNGELGDCALVRRAVRCARAVFCTDGGLRHARRLKLAVDVVVGDMDSLPRPLPKIPKTAFWCDFDEDRSDFEKALRFARDAGFERVLVAGAFGGRVDHALVNLALIEKYSAQLDLALLDRGLARLLGPGRYAAFAEKGETFSLLAAPRARVSVSAAKFPLTKFALEAGSRGLSNVSRGRSRLTVHSGRVWLVCRTRLSFLARRLHRGTA